MNPDDLGDAVQHSYGVWIFIAATRFPLEREGS